MRLNKFLAECGVDSRRNCDRLIAEGHVKVNGKIVREMGFCIKEDTDTVTFDGRRVKPKRNVYLMLHKPKGYITSVKDELGRKTVMEFLKGVKTRVYPIGRLDYDTEGLLLFTNDGELSYGLTHPSREVPKTYVARISGKISAENLKRLEKGVSIEGKTTAPAKAVLLEQDEHTSRVELTIREGRNRQIKKMFEAVGHEVEFLKRTAVGELHLGGLSRGAFRYLTEKEVAYLKEIAE